MKKILFVHSILAIFVVATPAYAAAADVAKIQTFMTNVIQVLVTLSALVASVFFVIGGFHYITSSGNPMKLDKAKSTLLYSAIGLVVVLGAFIITNIVGDLGTQAFGK